ncbi:putative Vacuolar protein sorting-associated protein 33B [Hypsibius exemplaris]|uniref:Vacuolar protein sorting-associated protein 33B n=1 Tax=Hypsibius exemplaris TaxID=2072580 RepID=A0A1W0WYP1_HYPEX|nr:putative Vacuolar protein sorting-associated protein 33B [Hypsibius exemplaris]
MTYVLRLLCLYAVTYGGIPSRLFNQWRADFLQSYGYEHLKTLHHLKTAGLLYEYDNASVNLSKIGVRKSRFGNLAKLLNLLPARKTDCDIRNPKDVSYLFNGAYIPLTYRLIEQVLVANKLPGFAEAAKNLAYSQCTQEVRSAGPHSGQNVMVLILGGCTYSELAAFRALGRSLDVNLIVSSTAFFGGQKFIQSLVQSPVVVS